MADRAVWLEVGRVPVAGAGVQLHHFAGELIGQLRLQDVGEELVVSKPTALVVERNDEEVGVFEQSEHGRAVACAGHRIAERSRQPFEDGRLQEEVSDRHGLALQYFFDEVVHDVTVVAREGADELACFGTSLQRQRGKLQGTSPAFRPGLKAGDVVVVEAQSHEFVEECACFLGRETKVLCANLREFAPRPETGERDGRVHAGGQDHVHVRRKVVEEEGHPALDAVSFDEVVVIEDKPKRARFGGDLVEDDGEHCFDKRRLRRIEQFERPAIANRGPHRGERADDVSPEGDRVVVGQVQGEPGDGGIGRQEAGSPFGEQRSLAKARRSREQDELSVRPALHSLDEPPPRHLA